MALKSIKVYLNDDLYNFFKDFSTKQNKSLSNTVKDCLKLIADTIKSIKPEEPEEPEEPVCEIIESSLAAQNENGKILKVQTIPKNNEMSVWWDNMEKRLYQKIVAQRKKL